MPFPQNFLDELLARSDIVDIVGSYVSLTPKGGSYWGCCPFHSEKTPSFHVVPDRQIFKCFGCGKGGGVITFIMEIENLPFVDAVRLLAQRAGMTMPETGENEGYRRRRDTNAYYAAMYLLTSNDDIYRRTANCFCKDGIEFGYAVLKNTSPHNYALFMAARDLCDKTEAVTMADLAEPEVIDPEALRLIVNATLIARYGLAAFQIRARGAEYER